MSGEMLLKRIEMERRTKRQNEIKKASEERTKRQREAFNDSEAEWDAKEFPERRHKIEMILESVETLMERNARAVGWPDLRDGCGGTLGLHYLGFEAVYADYGR